MITIKDIAQKLGVSPSTVTRALADNPRISAQTRQRVRKVADEMGYVPNAAAKHMRSQQSTLIGLLIPDIENSFYAQIAKAFSEVCNQQQYQLVLAVTDDTPSIEQRHVRELVEARCAGIAIVPTAELTPDSAKMLASVNTSQLIRRHDALKTDWYGINDIEAIRQATNCLLDLEHRRIALICGDESLNSGDDRLAGYTAALNARKIAPEAALIKRGPPRAAYAQFAMGQLKAMDNPPTAILAAGAGLTEGMLNIVTGWPDEEQQAISLIGYSDHSAFRWWRQSGLTVVDLPVGDIAADLCLSLIQRAQTSPRVDVSPGTYLYDSRLILRGSVSPLNTD